MAEKTKVQYKMLDEDQCAELAESAYRILATTGCLVKNAKARNLLKSKGASIEGELVKIPIELSKWAVEQAPSEITLYNRDGEAAMELKPGNTYFGPAITITQISDPNTGERRKTVTQDCVNCAVLLDALPNMSWVSPCVSASDADAKITDIAELYAILTNTNKPMMYWSSSMKNLAYQFEMFEAVAGGEDKLREKPFMINLICPMDPLVHNDDSMAQIMYLAGKKSPVVYIAGIGFGLSGPATIAGSIALGIADTLVGLIVSQIVNPGTPFVVSKFSDNVDMSNMSICHSMPEMLKANAASADVFRYMNLPFCLNFAQTDSGRFDQVAAFDKGVQIYTALLSRTNMNFAMGCYESGAYMKMEDLVYGNEIIGFLRVLTAGLEVSEETLAEDTIHEVGPGGAFYMEEHTMEHLHDFWKPDIMMPRTESEWRKTGEVGYEHELNQRVKAIISEGTKHPLPAEIMDKVNAIYKRAKTSG
jgi:trimethylamine--corrinoid protein Co-methyltransferase